MNSARFNPQMLTVARALREITQGELAARLGTTQGRISKIEHGLLEPAPDLVEQFGQAMSLPINFFHQPGHLYTLPVRHHRKRAQVSKRVLDRIHAEITVRTLNIATLLNSAEVRSEYTVPELDLDESGLSPEGIAKHLRHMWELPRGPLEDLTQVVEDAGVLVVPCDFGSADVDAVGMRMQGMPPLMFVNQGIPADRMRFTIAHELGHLVMHPLPSETMEDEANRFASEFLMPEDEIRPQLRGLTVSTLAVLKRVWRVSMAAILERARRLKVIGQRAYIGLRRTLAANGWLRREPPELDLTPESPMGLRSLVTYFLEELGYDEAQLSRILSWEPKEFARLYLTVHGGHLRLVV